MKERNFWSDALAEAMNPEPQLFLTEFQECNKTPSHPLHKTWSFEALKKRPELFGCNHPPGEGGNCFYEKYVIYSRVGGGNQGSVFLGHPISDPNCHFIIKLIGDAQIDINQKDISFMEIPGCGKIHSEALALSGLRGTPYINQLIEAYFHDEDEETSVAMLVYKPLSLKVTEKMRSTTHSIRFWDEEDGIKCPTFAVIGEYGITDNMQPAFNEIEVAKIGAQLVKGFCFLHAQGITHGDFHLKNFIIDTELRAQIIDLGRAILMRTPDLELEYSYSPHLEHMLIPEIVAADGELRPFGRRTFQVPKLDVWALGVCLFMMLHGFPPWEEADHTGWCEESYCDRGQKPAIIARRLRMLNKPLKIADHFSHACKKALKAMLCINPKRRPTMKRLAQFDWFADDWWTYETYKFRLPTPGQPRTYIHKALGVLKNRPPYIIDLTTPPPTPALVPRPVRIKLEEDDDDASVIYMGTRPKVICIDDD